MMEYVVEENIMPPWFADAGSGPWVNDRGLSERDRTDLLAWIDTGTPAGDPVHAHLPRQWPEEWRIGTPDAVVQIPQAVSIPAEGYVDYQYMAVIIRS